MPAIQDLIALSKRRHKAIATPSAGSRIPKGFGKIVCEMGGKGKEGDSAASLYGLGLEGWARAGPPSDSSAEDGLVTCTVGAGNELRVEERVWAYEEEGKQVKSYPDLRKCCCIKEVEEA
ncbi:hypothetical protein SBOR_0255 [Sclerotinia borealis F-4128]|uniref:Uncharacterized protein n=1 Tax=Sclerotinia borealis (strain F-4128) TaxID=1432307 RepID=W9CXP1_SCLBF|nr:hypothetical protein SBOR_0255 [Sclerotinia borealis F-4128]